MSTNAAATLTSVIAERHRGGQSGLLIRGRRCKRATIARTVASAASDQHAGRREGAGAGGALAGELGHGAADLARPRPRASLRRCAPRVLPPSLRSPSPRTRRRRSRAAPCQSVRRRGRAVGFVGREVTLDALRDLVPHPAIAKHRDRVVHGRGVGDRRVRDRVGTSPATSEAVRLTIRAGPIRTARRPPLTAETCLRTAFTSLIGAPTTAAARAVAACRRGRRPRGRLARAELPPVNAASTRSSSPSESAASISRRAASALRSVGGGWSAERTSIRSAGDLLAGADDDDAADQAVAARSAAAAKSTASPSRIRARRSGRRRGRPGTRGRRSRRSIGGGDSLLRRARDVARGEAGGGDAQGRCPQVPEPVR